MNAIIDRRQALHAELLAADSATAVLQRRCGGPVHIRRTAPDILDTDAACAALLHAAGGEAVTRRQVTLERGNLILSEAALWYLAARLPPDMAQELASTTHPFGHVVRSLGLRRTTLSARLCAPGEPHALEHRALLTDPGGRPMALVNERYGWGLFGSS